LAAARQTSIDAVLLSLRMQPSSAGGPAKAAAAAGNDVMMVKIGRYIVTGPNCPDWTKPESDDFSNTAPSNYGCATLTNLGMMVANPADLVRGATMGPADGDYAAGGVAAYHAGAIDKGVTFSSDSGGGS
jgi:pilus assembly protein CpaD